ncbi:MAG: ribonuclease III [Oscillospiraceae bacterium]|nr:ribonuclease III [Oscillospiraceae bacterium]
MGSAFERSMSREQVNTVSALGLAHVGDGVYELLVRARLCERGERNIGMLHRDTVAAVNAAAQARAAEKLLPLLTEEEFDVFRRARNTKVHGVPAHASVGDYHAATGLEALFGWLYLLGRTERIEELFEAAAEE